MVRTHSRHATGAFCAFVMILGSASASFGAATLIEDNRLIDIYIDAYDFSGDNAVNPDPILADFGDEFSDFDSLLEASPSMGAEGGVSAQQLSDFSSSPTTVFNSYRASGSVTANGFEFSTAEPTGVHAIAESNASIVFELTEQHTYSLIGGLSGSDDNKVHVEAELLFMDGPIIYATSTPGPIESTGMLNPGIYELNLEASVNALTDNNFGVFDLDASFNSVLLSLKPVPEPATLAFVALGGAALLLARRRR